MHALACKCSADAVGRASAGILGTALPKFGWDKRWFELLQADTDAGIPPSFVYYDAEKHSGGPKGTIVLNQGAMLMSGEERFSWFERIAVVALPSTQRKASRRLEATLCCAATDTLRHGLVTQDRA